MYPVEEKSHSMASAAPRLGGGLGVEVPVGNYTAGVVDSFPRANRIRSVEAAVSDRITESIAPVNQTTNQKITDRYISFHIQGVEGTFVDLSSLGLELALSLSKADGEALNEDTNIVLVNGLLNTLFKNVQVYIGNKLVESANMNSYTSYIKLLTHNKSHLVKMHQRLAYFFNDYRGSGCKDTFDDSYFANLNQLEKKVINSAKQNGLHLIGNLFLDTVSFDQYLLDNTDIKIKMELNNDDWIMNSDAALTDVKLNINSANLLIDKIIPRPSALLALHKSLTQPNAMLEYMYTNTLTRAYTLGLNQTTISINNPFNACVPDRLFMVFMDMEAYNGSYTRNGIYFNHYNLNSLNVSLNGSAIYNINCKFPSDYSQLYYTTCKTLGLESDHLVHHDSFDKGRCVIALKFTPEHTEDTINLERNGNLKIDLKFDNPINKNIIILLMGETQATMNIDGSRTILNHVRG